MSKRISKAQRAKNLVAKGYSNKYIFEHFPYVPKQAVYTARWLANKEKGIATLPKPEAVGQGTGIASSASAIPLQFEIIDRPAKKQSNARRNAQLARRRRERLEREREGMLNAAEQVWQEKWQIPPGSICVTQPKPTLWQKIKSFFGA